jgi:hypothetical protein
MEKELLLKIGGIYNILCALLHVVAPKRFNWNVRLQAVPENTREFIMQNMHIGNWCLTMFWLIFAYVALVHTSELLIPGLGRTLLASIVIFWVIRIFVLQPLYIGIKNRMSWQMIAFFLVGLLLFFVPLVQSLRSH